MSYSYEIEFKTTRNYINQMSLLAEIVKAYREKKNIFLTGSGGCLDPDTDILMYDGSIKKVVDVKVGDKLMGDDSKCRNVLSTTSGIDDMYLISPKKGDPFICNSDHILTLMKPNPYIQYREQKTSPYYVCYYNDKGRKSKSFKTYELANTFMKNLDKDLTFDIGLQDFLKISESARKDLYLYHTGVDFDKKEVSLDPYLLGYWLGDGTSMSPNITTADIEIVDEFNRILNSSGMECRKIPSALYGYRIGLQHNHDNYHGESSKPKNLFTQSLKKYNLLNNKHIPDDYKLNDRNTRLKVLAGLIDSDGHVYGNQTNIEITQKSYKLAKDIEYLCFSLGFMVTFKKTKKSCEYNGEKREGDYYRMVIYGDNLHEIPTILLRKNIQPRNIKKRSNINNFTVSWLKHGEYYGFTLDGNQRHLLGDFTVTHNCGKSYSIIKLIETLKAENVDYALTATTGVSALSIGGTTIHSWSGVRTAEGSKEGLYLTVLRSKAVKRWKTVQFLILDEVSMLGRSLLEKLDYIAKKIRRNDLPFGGIQLLFSGDMLQLEPVKDDYAFESPLWEEYKFFPIVANVPYRYPDTRFFELLLRARKGKMTPEDHKLLDARKAAYQTLDLSVEGSIIPTKLFSKKMNVEEVNMTELDKLPGEEFIYHHRDAIFFKTKDPVNKAEHYQNIFDRAVPQVVVLKKGAQVMLTWNLDLENGLCNGSRGVVLECYEDRVLVKFKHCEQTILPAIWSMEDDTAKVARAQIPLILCWSTSIHKSQSATMDSVITDLGSSVWGPALGYVALSRCRELDGIYLINFWKEKIFPNPKALKFELELEKEYTAMKTNDEEKKEDTEEEQEDEEKPEGHTE